MLLTFNVLFGKPICSKLFDFVNDFPPLCLFICCCCFLLLLLLLLFISCPKSLFPNALSRKRTRAKQLDLGNLMDSIINPGKDCRPFLLLLLFLIYCSIFRSITKHYNPLHRPPSLLPEPVSELCSKLPTNRTPDTAPEVISLKYGSNKTLLSA